MHFEIFKKKHKKTEIFHEIFHRQKNMFFTSLLAMSTAAGCVKVDSITN